MSAEIRIGQTSDTDQILSLYESLGYRQGIARDDTVWIAEASGEPIGIVRIAPEFGVFVLRGMRIAGPWQRRGIGTQMLHVVAQWVDGRDCYCVPYSHLPRFYGQIGFKEIAPESAPPFLAVRLNDYKQRGLNVILMARLNPKK